MSLGQLFTRKPIAANGPSVASSNATAASVKCDRVGKRFGQQEVLKNVSFSIEPGTFVSIVGPSGCGKTTLLKALGGLVPIDRGRIEIHGEEVKDPSPKAAFVFQNFGLFPWKTLHENVAFALKIRGTGRAEIDESCKKLLELVGLKGQGDKYPWQVSGGMQQRAGLARALAPDPEVLLMDEPFASVDAQTREHLHYELLSIWERLRNTVVFITHSIEEALTLSDRVLVFESHPGRLAMTIDVPIERPRDVEEVKGLASFNELRRKIWNVLQEDRLRNNA